MFAYVTIFLLVLFSAAANQDATQEYLDAPYVCSLSELVSDALLIEQRAINRRLEHLIALMRDRNANSNTAPSVSNSPSIPQNCKGISTTDKSGIYRIKEPLYSEKPFLVYCDQSEGGGWTVIQRRVDGKIDFYRNWAEYRRGFGNLESSFWIGLDKLHALTNGCVQELMIVLEDFNGTSRYARFETFAIGDSNEDYPITVLGTYSGTAGDSLRLQQGQKFTTFDRDNDVSKIANCAQLWEGAWWYESCYMSNLNGNYTRTGGEGITWNTIQKDKPLKTAKMMIRPKNGC